MGDEKEVVMKFRTNVLLRNYSIALHRIRACREIFWRYMGGRTKRTLDLIAIGISLPITIPIFLICIFSIKINSKGPAFFSQKRVGKNGELFNFYKFRSMVVNAEKLKDDLVNKNESKDGVIFKMKDDPRITKVGKLLRRTSLDELPQLINILKGDMTLVGPRPPVPREVSEYNLNERKRLEVVPGLTCIWQVSGRSEIPFKQQVLMDKDYIRTRSFKQDIKLLFKTIPAVLFGKGAY